MKGNKFYFENDSLVCLGHNRYKRVGRLVVGDRIWVDYGVSGIVAKIERMVRHDMIQVNSSIMHVVCSKNSEVYTTRGFKRADELNIDDTYMNFFLTGYFLPGKWIRPLEENIHCTYLLIACDEVFSETIIVNNFKFKGNCFDATNQEIEIKKKKRRRKKRKGREPWSVIYKV
ncbi:MAG: hypothetical protein IKM20_08270 [Erysipelotrichales bacterium]|nr:hypothetical protein [Erysipelotrichales bacterium]